MYNIPNTYQNPGYPTIPNLNTSYPNYYYQQTPQQYMQNNLPNGQQVRIPISGRIIGNVSEIVPNEVPMDGSVSLFPQNDYSCIYAKKWNTDGTIQTVKFVPVVDDADLTKTSTNDFNVSLASDINEISNRLSKIEELLTQSKTTTRTTKEASK